jgi:hypothetical protein
MVAVLSLHTVRLVVNIPRLSSSNLYAQLITLHVGTSKLSIQYFHSPLHTDMICTYVPSTTYDPTSIYTIPPSLKALKARVIQPAASEKVIQKGQHAFPQPILFACSIKTTTSGTRINNRFTNLLKREDCPFGSTSWGINKNKRNEESRNVVISRVKETICTFVSEDI